MLRPDAPPVELYAGSLIVEPVVSSWLGGRQLASGIPVVSGSFAKTVTMAEPERLELVVPRFGADGTDWLPRSADAPLARYGQVLDVALKVTDPVTDRSWTVRLGRCRIQEVKGAGADVRVSGVGLMARLEGHGIGKPSVPGRGATLASEVRRLVAPTGLEVWVDPALADRAIPEDVSWGANRMETLLDLVKAWPARMRSDVDGRVLFLPPLAEDVRPVTTLTDGSGGTVVEAPIEDSRDGIYNHVIVRGKDADKNGNPTFQVEEAATWGPFSVRTYDTETAPVVTSELVRSQSTAREVAKAELVKALSTARVLPVIHAPDYRLDVDVPVEVITHNPRSGVDVHEWGYVVGVDIPLTAGDGDMRTDVGVFR